MNMQSVFWFWFGTVVGSFVGFGCFCLLQTASDPDEDAPREMIRR